MSGEQRLVKFWKVTPFIALTTAIVLLVAGIAMAVFSERSYKAQKAAEVTVQARILASTVTAALSFTDRNVGQEYVTALRANEEVVAAAVYDAKGALFVSFNRAGASVPDSVTVGEPVFAKDRLTVTEPVVQEGSRLGTVYLQTVTEPIERRLMRYAGILLLVLMAAVMVTVLGAAQSALTRANAELAARAKQLAEANTELLTQIEEREKVEAALRQAQKMETIGQLTGGVAHDFNNLLTIIMGNLETLNRQLDGKADPVRMRRATDFALRGAERAAALTQSLLAFSRRQPLEPRPIDANKMVANMSDLLRRTLGERIAIQTVQAGGLWPTLADPNQLESAILNLAVNARDAMPQGGNLTIETANAHLDEVYTRTHTDLVPGQYVVIAISDTGIGMTKEVMAQAFEPFFTTKDVGHGTGLGLSQVYGFVKQSGGHVKIYSEVGQGTTVKIYLPRLMGAATEADVGPVQPEIPVSRRGMKVLVVEDDDDVRAHSTGILSELGFTVIEAGNGPAALDLLEKHGDVNLLFTDVGLPGGMNGRQLAEEVRRRRPELKVLFTTGYAKNAIVHDGRLDPGVQLVTKPFTFQSLAAKVTELLDQNSSVPCVLVVEDEALVRMVAVASLQDEGFEVMEAMSAGEALSKVKFIAGRLDAAIIDIGLPDKKGDVLAREIRQLRPTLPILIATGHAEADIGAGFASDPLVRVLGKPYDSRKLLSILEGWGISAASPARP
jgi:signal transduction histidine kinase/CheY-like chemotaxis protein